MRTLAGLALALLVAVACTPRTDDAAGPSPGASASATPLPAPTPTPTFDPGPVILPTVAIPTPSPEPTPENSLVADLDTISVRATAIRQLYLRATVDRSLISREELGAILLTELEEDRSDILETQELYVALGILEPDDDLFEILLGVFSEGVVGLFDTEEDRLYVVAEPDDFSLGDELTYVHEYVHALQQQHFDIHAMREGLPDNSDQARAFSALAEGDATTAQLIYMLSHFDRDTQAEAMRDAARVEFDAFDQAPHVVQRTTAFPYEEGVRFAFGLVQTANSWDLVNAAFGDPPASTEQVLHLEKYLAGEEPIAVEPPDAGGVLGDGWSLLATDALGEFLLKSYLEGGLEAADAGTASSGWGGDAFSLYRDDGGRKLLLSVIEWDSEEDAREFYDALGTFMESTTEGTWTLESEGEADRTLEIPGRVVYSDLRGTSTPLIFAPDAESLDLVRSVIR